MIKIPKKMKTIDRKGDITRHYILLEDKCTERLAVYQCLETGHIETWLKTDFMKKNEKEKIQ